MLTLLVIDNMDDFIVSVHFSSPQMIFSCCYRKKNYVRDKILLSNPIKSSAAVLDHKHLWCLATDEPTAGSLVILVRANQEKGCYLYVFVK